MSLDNLVYILIVLTFWFTGAWSRPQKAEQDKEEEEGDGRGKGNKESRPCHVYLKQMSFVELIVIRRGKVTNNLDLAVFSNSKCWTISFLRLPTSRWPPVRGWRSSQLRKRREPSLSQTSSGFPLEPKSPWNRWCSLSFSLLFSLSLSLSLSSNKIWLPFRTQVSVKQVMVFSLSLSLSFSWLF